MRFLTLAEAAWKVVVGIAGHDGLLLLYRMTAELVPECSDHFRGKRILLPRGKSGKQREHQDRGGNTSFDGFFNGPTSLAGIFDVTAYRSELRILVERVFRQLQKPRSHDAALIPEVRNAPQIEVELRCVQKLESFAIGLKHSVF